MPSVLTSFSRNARKRTNDASYMKRNNTDGDHLQFSKSLSSVIPSITTSDNDSFLNKIVIVTRGSSVGLKGKVTKIEDRGWWTIDNPKLGGKKVQGRSCRLVSSMKASHVQQYEAMVGSSGKQYGHIDLNDQPVDTNQGMYNTNNRRGSMRKKRSKRATSFQSSQPPAKKYKLRDCRTYPERQQDNITFPYLSPVETAEIKKNFIT